MHDAIPLPNLSSCFALQIRAKLKRRVHWLCCVCFHIHNMPMSVRFFKPPLTSFHRLVGFYPRLPFCLLLMNWHILMFISGQSSLVGGFHESPEACEGDRTPSRYCWLSCPSWPLPVVPLQLARSTWSLSPAQAPMLAVRPLASRVLITSMLRLNPGFPSIRPILKTLLACGSRTAGRTAGLR